MIQRLETKDAPAPIGPYSQATWVEGLMFISGQIPVDPANNQLETSSIEIQTHRVMKNIAALLQLKGLGFEHVIKTSIFVKDLNNFQKINEIYGAYFSAGNYPARETVEVSRLPKDVDLEISCIAYHK